jgi:hypothetical protein
VPRREAARRRRWSHCISRRRARRRERSPREQAVARRGAGRRAHNGSNAGRRARERGGAWRGRGRRERAGAAPGAQRRGPRRSGAGGAGVGREGAGAWNPWSHSPCQRQLQLHFPHLHLPRPPAREPPRRFTPAAAAPPPLRSDGEQRPPLCPQLASTLSAARLEPAWARALGVRAGGRLFALDFERDGVALRERLHLVQLPAAHPRLPAQPGARRPAPPPVLTGRVSSLLPY